MCNKSWGCAYLHVLEAVLRANDTKHILLTTLLHLAREKELVKDEVCLLEVEYDVKLADVAVIFVHLLYVAVYDLEGDELIVGGIGGGNKEERSISAVNDFCVWIKRVRSRCGRVMATVEADEGMRSSAVGDSDGSSNVPLYSRKLHMRARLARTSCETSLMILALSLGERVVNHFARRCRMCGLVRWRQSRHTGEATYNFALTREQDQVSQARHQPCASPSGP